MGDSQKFCVGDTSATEEKTKGFIERVKEAGKCIVSIFKGGWEMLKSAGSFLIDFLRNFPSNAWEIIKTCASNIWDWIKSVGSKAWEFIKNFTSNAWSWIKNMTKTAWDWIKRAGSFAWEKIKSFTKTAWDWLTNPESWELIISFPITVWNWIKTTGPQAWEWIKNITKDAWNWLKTNGPQAWDWIVTTAIKIKDKISNFCQNPLAFIFDGCIALGKILKDGYEAFKRGLITGTVNFEDLFVSIFANIRGFFTTKRKGLIKNFSQLRDNFKEMLFEVFSNWYSGALFVITLPISSFALVINAIFVDKEDGSEGEIKIKFVIIKI